MGYDGTLKFDTAIDSSGFQKGLDKISGIASGALKATGAVLGGAATAVAGIGAAAIKAGSDFEAGMSKVEAISGASSADMEKLTAKAKEMGAKTKFSATESAEAFQYMAMAGWKTGDMLDGISGIMNLAAASGEDLGRTSDIVTDALTSFGLSASDAGHFSDVLAQASSNANTNVGMMGETFKYVAPVAGTLGYSAEDCATAIGLMANSSIKGSQAGTYLRAILTRMSKPTKEVQAAMDALGVSMYNSDGSAKSLSEVMIQMRKGFAGLTQEQKSQIAATIGGQEAMTGLLAIVNASESDYKKLEDSIYNADGASQRMADTMNDNLQGALTLCKSALESVGIAIYEEFQTPMKEAVQSVTKMVDEMNTAMLNDGFDGLVQAFGNSLAELAQMAMDAAPTIIGIAEDIVTTFISSILDHKSEFASAGAAVVSQLAQAILNVTGDMWSAGIVLFTEFLQAMTDHSKEIGVAFGQMVKNIGSAARENIPIIIQAARDIVDGFCDGLSEEFPAVSALIQGFADGFIGSLGSKIESVIDILSGLFGVFDKANPDVLEAIGYALGYIAASMVALKVAKEATSSVNSLFKVLGNFKSGIVGIAGTIGKVAEGFALLKGGAGSLMEVIALEFPKVASVLTTIGGAATKAIGFVTKFGSSIAGIGSIVAGVVLAVKNFADMFVNGFSAVKEAIMLVGIALTAVGAVILGAPALVAAAVAGIVAAIATVAVVVKDNWNQIVGFFKAIPSKLSEIGAAIADWFSGALNSVGKFIDSVVKWFSELPDKIGNAIDSVKDAVVKWGASTLQAATQAAQKIVTSVVQFFTDLPYKIGYAIGYTIGELVKWSVGVINWITTNVPLIIESIVSFFSELPGKIWSWLTTTYENLKTWGAQMLENGKEVAKSCVDGIVEYFSALPQRIWSFLLTAYENITSWGIRTVQKGKEAASNTIDAITSYFSALPDRIWNVLLSALNNVAKWASDMAAKGRQAASELCSAVINGVSGLPGQMKQIGKNIVDGVWQGIQSAKSWFTNQVNSFFSGIVHGAKKALGIHSPSKVFADEVGKFIPQGISVGIKAEMPDLYKQMDSEMAAFGKKMRTAVEIQTGDITVRAKTDAEHQADTDKPKPGGDTYIDNHIDQTNTYNTPVATPSEVSKSQREAARKLLGGVK